MNKALILLFFLWISTPLCWAQYKLDWIRNFGKSGNDAGKCVLPSKDGNIWVIGFVENPTNTKADAWIIKVNPEGRNLWDVSYGGRKWDEARAAVTTESGGLVIMGVTESKGEGKADIWLFELNSEGEMLWDRTYGGKNWEEGYGLIQTKDGGFLITGSYKAYQKEDDLWTIRTDKTGKVLWEVRKGGEEWEGGHDLLELPDGSFMVVGHTASESLGSDDGWLLKISAEGTLLWSKHFGGADRDAMHSIISPNDSTLLVAGFTRSKGNGQADMWLLNIDLEGELRWEKTIGGGDFEKARAMIQTSDGHLLFAGYTHSQGLGNGDAWLVKTTIEGEKIWEDTFGGPGFDKAFSLTELPDKSIVMIGSINLAGQQNILTIKLSLSK